MFGKEKKALTEELEEARAKLEILEARDKGLRDKQNEIDAALSSASASASSLDQGLNRVVDKVKAIGQNQDDAAGFLQAVGDAVDSLGGVLQTQDKLLSERETALYEEKTMSEQLVDDSKYYTGITKSLRNKVGDCRQKTKTVVSELEKMGGFAGNISELSLTAALEAGRLGESGMPFVETAEEIRGAAEEHEEFVEKVKENLADLQSSFDDTAEEIKKLTGMLRDNNNLLMKITEHVEAACKKADERTKADIEAELNSVREAVSKMDECLSDTKEAKRSILDEMEGIGSDFITQGESLKTIEGVFQALSDTTENKGQEETHQDAGGERTPED